VLDSRPVAAPDTVARQPRSVVIVSSVAPYPEDAGKKVVIAGLVTYWAERVGAANVHYVLLTEPGTMPDGFPVRVHRVERPRTTEQLASLVVRTIATRRHTIQESMLYAPRVRRALAAVLAAADADVEIYDTVRLGQYAPELPLRRDQRRLVYLDDLFSLRYGRMLRTLRDGSGVPLDPLGEFRSTVPRALQPLARTPLAQRALLGLERRLVERRERASVGQFSACLLVSPQETRLLVNRTGAANVHDLPPLLRTSHERRERDKPGGPAEFVFVGLLSLPHNHDAMVTFLTAYMPAVLALIPEARLRIVGRNAQPDLLAAARQYGQHHVTVEGYVPDLDQVLGQAHAMISPLRFGSGLKVKVLEALARGVPVLTTTVGAEGIASGPQHGVLVEDDLDRHAALMRRLLEPSYNRELSQAALATYAATYSRDAVYGCYDRIFGF
jgi:glycosyltransferase involved in cell wall biosynthesis